jgi:nucleoside-diphosphate-sugar epimerase
MSSISSALVTGGAGFIGSHITAKLLSMGTRVRILDNMTSGRQENLDACKEAEFIQGDITSKEDCARACQGCEVVFHHAALVSVQESVAHPDKSFEINVAGTLNLLLAARDAGVRRFVLASSAAIYGDDPRLPKTEVMEATPISPYGADKAAAEHYVYLANSLWGFEGVVLRYFNVFGPRQDPDGPYAAVIPRFVSRIVTNTPPMIFGDGQQTRDFLFVQDVVAANLLAATHPKAPGGIFNIARGETTSLLELLGVIQSNDGLSIDPELKPAREGDIVHSSAHIGKAKSILGFAPTVSLADGLKSTADYFRQK